MVPKVIHYIWLGPNKISPHLQDCINYWYILMPDYKIILWNENNIESNSSFVKQMIEEKKWAFASDSLRLEILYKNGGIYLDTDMKLFKSLNKFLDCELFIGKETKKIISAGIIGSIPSHPLIKEALSYYEGLNSVNKIDRFSNNKVLIPEILTTLFKDASKDPKIIITEPEVFYPVSFENRSQVNIFFPSEQNYGVHLWNASWHDEINHLWSGNYRKSFKIFIEKLIFDSRRINLFTNYFNNICKIILIKLKL